MLRETLLARTLVELADTLVDDFGVVDLLTLLTERCVVALDVTTAGLMLASPQGELRLVASSSHSMHILESFELQTEEGPCLDCCRTGEPIVNLDLATGAHPWPRFAPLAREAGFHSVHAFPCTSELSRLALLTCSGPMRDKWTMQMFLSPKHLPTWPRLPSFSTEHRLRPEYSTYSFKAP